MKGKCDTFSSYKQTSSVCMVHFEVKLHKDVSKTALKCLKNDRNKVFRGKQPSKKVPLLFLDVNIFKERV